MDPQSQQLHTISDANTPNTMMAMIPKPKRPLSAFNLFYRYKRQKVIALNDANNNKETITNLVNVSPGMEDYVCGTTTTTLPEDMSLEEVNKLRRLNIRKEMQNNLKPRDSRTRLSLAKKVRYILCMRMNI